MHLLVHDRATGNPCLFPIDLIAVMPCAQQGGGAIMFGVRLVHTVESRNSLIEAITHCAPRTGNVVIPKFNEHAEAINQRAEAEVKADIRMTLRRFGMLAVNAVAHRRRLDLFLPVGDPVMFARAEDGEPDFSPSVSEELLAELAAHVTTLGADQLEKLIGCYNEHLRLMAGGEA